MQRMAALLTGDIRLAFHTPMDGVETAVAAAPDAGLKTTFESACEGGPLPAVPPPDRGRYFRAMFMTLISDDGALSDFQT